MRDFAFLAVGGARLRLVGLLVLLVAAGTSAAASDDYIQADARMDGKEIHSFADRGESVTIVLGGFKLTLDDRSISGQNAVLWVKTDDTGRLPRNDIVVYVEGQAKIVEPGGEVTDRMILVSVSNEGRFVAAGALSDQPLKDSALYRRALKARKQWNSPKTDKPAEKKALAPKPAPPLIVTSPAKKPTPGLRIPVRQTPTPTPAPRVPAGKAPVISPRPVTLVGDKLDQPRKTPKPAPGAVEPVNFSADSVSYKAVNERWVTIARGNVYLSQGSADSDQFLELRSQSAVVFIEQGVKDREGIRSPYGMNVPRMRFAGADQAVTGVYLEGDVVIARGDRYFRGPAAFYDFTTGRAVITEPVFRTIHKSRDIPIYIRASQARVLSEREIWFADAKVSTSEFYTPTYHIGARRVYLMDTTPYDREGQKIGEQSWHAKLTDTTFNIRGIPLMYSPMHQGDLEQGNTSLRKASIGRGGRFGWGVETQWHLFRLLGILKPEGFKGRATFNVSERGALGGIDLSYSREKYSGYHMLYGMFDSEKEDSFGDDREDIESPSQRGRVLMRHKQFLPNDWQLQFELSYFCDRNFLEVFFPDEFYAGKEQETLLYAKKQKDNWAFTSLMQVRLNRFDMQTESYPDLGLFLIGQPLLGDRLTFFHESHAGVKRFLLPNRVVRWGPAEAGLSLPWDDYDSGHFIRLDMREEVNLPLHVGPINIVPYAIGRATYWGDRWPSQFSGGGVTLTRLDSAKQCRPYGQVGIRANTHVWAVFDNVHSRLWDLHRLKHIITPEVTTWVASSHGVMPENLFPMDASIERHLDRTSGMAFNVYQRLQTKRGPAGDRRTVDWMRLNLSLGVYDNHRDTVPSDGRFFWYQPEYSLGRNHFNAEYFWHISDSTTLMADMNYDMDDRRLGRGNIGIAVKRDPRLRYYAGLRYIDDLDTTVGTLGVDYQLTSKYSISVFEQYDFTHDSGTNLSTSVTITRKLPRWYAAFTFSFDATEDELTLMLTFWPEGIEEARIGGAELTLLGQSDKN